jgi:hypothetical protein
MSTFIELLRQHHQALETEYSSQLSHDMKKAIYAMLTCKTNKQGKSLWACSSCEHHDSQALSCGNRNCPQCMHSTTSNWLERQKQKRLPVEYYMTTFTLPYELRVLVRRRPKAMYKIMFSVSASIMKDFAKTSKLGDIGFTSVLHTHSRKRDFHPHIHMMVANGGYDAKRNQWKKGKKGYLFNEFALAKVWRARIFEAINKHPELSLNNIKRIPKKWVVDCTKVGYGLPALKYLSRYLYRGVLADKDIISHDKSKVTFRYIDSTTKKTEKRTLPTLEFLLLILQHVLPQGLQRVRDYGILSSGARKIRLLIQYLLTEPGHILPPSIAITKPKAKRTCPCCKHHMLCTGVIRAG